LYACSLSTGSAKSDIVEKRIVRKKNVFFIKMIFELLDGYFKAKK
jgi:hypothetical protein